MLTSDSFFSLQTQHDQSQGNTNTTNKQENKTKRDKAKERVPSVGLSYVKLGDTAALFIKWTSDTTPLSRCLNW